VCADLARHRCDHPVDLLLWSLSTRRMRAVG
jgi:hypothetical protein